MSNVVSQLLSSPRKSLASSVCMEFPPSVWLERPKFTKNNSVGRINVTCLSLSALPLGNKNALQAVQNSAKQLESRGF